LVLDERIGGSVFVQNAERHTHGVGAPDLGLAAWRSAVVLNALTDGRAYALPSRTAFTTFGLAGAAAIPAASGARGAARGTSPHERPHTG
ncbi:MAG TPA: lysine 6-monooxygenase, partial [Streptomyces sp.]|nr:lysine 6-monooxygenase [Streptomyces sp.]